MSLEEARRLLDLARSGVHVYRHQIQEALIASGDLHRNMDAYWDQTVRVIPAGQWTIEPKAPATWLDGLVVA